MQGKLKTYSVYYRAKDIGFYIIYIPGLATLKSSDRTKQSVCG